MSRLKIMITGHRPNKLGGYCEDNPIRLYIKQEIKKVVSVLNNSIEIEAITGMAIGADQDYAKVCLELGIPYIAYIPFVGQESSWPAAAKQQYSKLLSQAKETVIVSEGNYSPKKMQLRNEAMSNDCDLAFAVWNGDEKGGTVNCVRYLRQIEKPIIRINPNEYRSN